MPAGLVIGRGEELGAVEAFLANMLAGPACMALSGQPGMGKTTVWEAAIEGATRRNLTVLVHRAAEAEASFSFGGLTDLMSKVLYEVAEALPDARKSALLVALRLAEPDAARVQDQLAIGLAVLDALRALASRRPVLIAIDDLQWLDPSSASALNVALRRVQNEPIGLIATLRQDRGVIAPIDLERTLGGGAVTRVLGPLSVGDFHQLLRQRLSLELTRPELARVWDASAGNPFYALELGRELTRKRTRPRGGTGLQLPETLRDLIATRLAGLSAATLDILLFVAALARPSLELVADACGDRDRVIQACDEALHDGVIELEGDRLRFAHPLLASICYDSAPPWRRRAIHRQLAAVSSYIEERARHQALAAEGPAADVAADLERAAGHAAARGATAAAAELAELAVELTPPGEPSDRGRRKMNAAGFHFRSGDLEQARTILAQLLNEVPHGRERADVLLALALNGRSDLPTRVRLCREAINEAAADEARCAGVKGYLAICLWRMGDVQSALAEARAGLDHARRTSDDRLLAAALGYVGLMEHVALDLTPGLLEYGVQVEQTLERPLPYNASPTFTYAYCMEHRDQLAEARRLFEELAVAARAAGDEPTSQWIALQLVSLEWYVGNWQRALELATMVFEFAQQAQDPQYQSMVYGIMALVEVDLGLLEAARRSAEEGVKLSQAVSDESSAIVCTSLLGRLGLLAGDLEAAGRHLRDLPDRARAAGLLGPMYRDLWTDSIETLIELGELERARDHLGTFGELASLASHRWVASAARCRGLLAAAERDLETGLLELERALLELQTLHYPFERARTLLALGKVRRLAGQKAPARVVLEEALDVFDQLGAVPWLARASAELRRISGRPSPPQELTETELRVASLAAQGLSNQEIASALYMGISTVEAHLSHVYRKLDARRAELAIRLQPLGGGQTEG